MTDTTHNPESPQEQQRLRNAAEFALVSVENEIYRDVLNDVADAFEGAMSIEHPIDKFDYLVKNVVVAGERGSARLDSIRALAALFGV